MGKLKDKRKCKHIYRKVKINIPERGKNEDPVTANQIGYIKKLSPGIRFEEGIESLGKWQASAIIDQIKEQQEELEDDIAEGNINKGRKRKRFFWLVVIIIIVYVVVKYGH